MTTHTLKCWPEHFGPVVEGRKRLELRLDDRDYQVGDILCLREWEPLTNAYARAGGASASAATCTRLRVCGRTYSPRMPSKCCGAAGRERMLAHEAT